ncbi:amino acid permease [Histoplasma capsulatum H143]|uniref:Amino acid permease n=1 Tax=Ajellomyces capsulatus (strain H143) TaxID=544712 RepID=C6HIA4_AJECH|nr:amino acid permease [Histoplasma capsulatum H143]
MSRLNHAYCQNATVPLGDKGQVASVLPKSGIPVKHAMGADERALVSLGYRQEFNREFSLWTTFCVSFSVLGLLPSFASTLWYGMGYAGTAGMVWGWPIAMAFIQCVAMSMAELCSAMPTSGGLYYASAVLAPPKYGPFAAWFTGWSNWIAQVTAAPSVNYGVAAMILAAVSMSKPGYIPTDYQTFLLTTSIMILHAVLSSMPTKWIANLNSHGSILNIIALTTVLIAIPVGTTNSPKFTPSSVVWGAIYEGTSFPKGLSVLMSFVSVIWAMSGYDAPFHLSEECSNANLACPRAIVITSGVGGLMGWFLQLVVAYTVTDITAVLKSNLGQPWASYLFQVMSDKLAVSILVLTIICGFSMGQGCMVTASRVTYAYARDDCLPLSKIWKKVNPYTHTPVNAVWFNCAIGILSCLLILAGNIAIGALFSIGAIASFTAFAIPIAIRILVVGDRFRPGPWNLGKYSTPIGAAGVLFVVLMVPILCLPTTTGSELSPKDVNWTCIAYGGPMLLVTIWWFVDAHRWFKGPKVNIEHILQSHEEEPSDAEGIIAYEGSRENKNSSAETKDVGCC